MTEATNPRSRALSIVIPTLGNREGLARVLDALEAQVPVNRFEVIVVPDLAEPEPGSVATALADRPYETRMPAPALAGASANRNAGWRDARSPIVLFIDDDTVPQQGLIDEHLAWHEQHPDTRVGVLGHVRWARELHKTAFMHWLDHGMQFDYPAIDGIEAGWGRFYSANASVKRDLLEAVGGFDEERLPYLYEDLDLAYRASAHGFRLLYNRRAVVEHLREMDLEFWRRKMPRLAVAEHSFVTLHPEIPPYFHDLFRAADQAPAARGLGRHLIRWVPRGFPLLGQRAWTSADLHYRKALAPAFLDAWHEATEGVR